MPKDTFFNLPEDKKQRILNAAIDQFSGLHYKDVTINGIVQAAGIPKGSFYQYFENKDDLYIFLFTDLGDTKIDLFQNLQAEIPNIPFKDYVIKYITGLKKLERSNDRILQLKQGFLSECPQEIKNKILKEEMPKAIKVFQQVIEGYIEKGEFIQNLDSKIAAYIMVMSISNLEYYAYDEGEDAMSVLMGIIDTLAYSMSRSI